MDQVTKIKNQYRAEQWANVIRECQASGQTVTSWCESHDVGIKAYYYWLRRLRMATIQKSNPNALAEAPKEEPAVFKKLEVQTPVPNTQAADWQIRRGTYIENNVVGVDIPDGVLYLDKRLTNYDRFCMELDLNWLYKCKLYKDFGWYGDTYLVFTSLDYIRRNDDKDGSTRTNAYYRTSSNNEDKYIFFWNQTDESLIHELAHFADDTHNDISKEDDWKNIYYSEYSSN